MQASFEAAYRGEFRPVWRFVSRLTPTASTVEDLVHDVFLTAHRKWQSYDAARPLRPWLFGIAFRVVADHRALKRHAYEVPEKDDGPEAAAEPARIAEKLDAQRILDLALEQMPEDARAVFVMHELEEQPVPAIAEALGTLVPTAYTRLRAARQVFARVCAEHQLQEERS